MAVINGTEQGDFIFGNPEDDQIFGLGGDDFILGDGGNDTIEGGAATINSSVVTAMTSFAVAPDSTVSRAVSVPIP